MFERWRERERERRGMSDYCVCVGCLLVERYREERVCVGEIEGGQETLLHTGG